MSIKAYGKQTARPECGIVFIINPKPGRGAIHTNAHDLKAYIKRKAREGFKLVSVKKMEVANYQPHYMVTIEKEA